MNPLRDIGRPWLWLAPLAGVSDATFRTICHEHGADLTFTEMVSAKGLLYNSEKTRELYRPGKDERCLAVQLFGRDPEIMAEQAARIEDELGECLALIDVNMGCPVKKVVAKGEGSALMKEPEVAERIIAAIRHAVSCPVTAKIRRGWDIGDETAPLLAKRLEAAGASAIIVHGRYAKQYYRGTSDRGTIARTKSAVSIPVIGNGDVVSCNDAAAMLEETGCDGIMIGRGAMGNPWLFERTATFLVTGAVPDEPTLHERLQMAREHCVRHAAAGGNLVQLRTQAAHYLSGMDGASKARFALNECTTLQSYLDVLDAFEERLTDA